MAATIKIKNSSTAGAAPTSSDLVQGELAVNVTDKRLYTENSGGTIVELGTNPSVPVTFPDGSASAPSLTNSGDTNTGMFFPAADTIAFAEGGTESMRLDSAGNLGLGVTPSAWRSAVKAVELAGGTLYNNGTGTVGVAENAYLDAVGWKYKTTAAASFYEQGSGYHVWQTAASGTAGNAISFTQAMTLDASGNLLLGTTSGTSKFTISGSNNPIQMLNSGGANQSDIDFLDAQTLRIRTYHASGSAISFATNSSGGGNTERARIDSSGNLLVGTTSSTINGVGSAARARLYGGITSVANGNSNDNSLVFVVESQGNTPPVQIYTSANGTASGTAATMKLQNNGSTGRSINATGTVNASGADYAEYMTKAGDFTVAKGDVIGINADGKLTNVFTDAISFAVKSTDPSYVGNDKWGVELEGDELEAVRQSVDRIAFAGQVPVNVTGATAGQYIVPINDNGSIKGQAVSNPTFEQYQIAVGKVIAIEQDGRAKIIVKVA